MKATRRIALGALSAGAALVLTAGPALADDCVNLSRNTNPAQATKGAKPIADTVAKGSWVYLGEVWLFVTPGTQSLMGVDTTGLPGAEGSFTDGKGDGLLEQSGAASDGKRCEAVKGHGLAGECGEGGHA